MNLELKSHSFCNLPAGKRCIYAEGRNEGHLYDTPYEGCSKKCQYINWNNYLKAISENRKKKNTRAAVKRKTNKKYNPEIVKIIKNAEQEIKDGKGTTFKNVDEVKEFFKEIEKDDGKKFKMLNNLKAPRKRKIKKTKVNRIIKKKKGCGCK
jgi:hypothetical protein